MKSAQFPNRRAASNVFRAALVSLAVAVAPATAQQVPTDRPLTVADCVNAALGINPELKASQYDLKAADAAVWAERSALLPKLTGSAQVFLLDGEPVTPFGIVGITEPELIARNVDNKTGWLASLGVSYPLFQDGSILGINNAPAIASARAARQQQEWTRTLASENAIDIVTESYFNAVTAQSKAGLYERMAEVARQRVVIFQTKAQNELALTQDVQIAEARLRANEESLRSVRLRAQEGNAQLAQLLGVTGPAQLQLAGAPALPVIPPLDELLAKVTAEHPSLGIQSSAVEKARQDVRLNKSRMLPAVRLAGSYSVGEDFTGQGPDLLTAAVVAEMPLFDFGHGWAALRESKNRLRAEEARVDLAQYDLRRSVLNVLSELRDIEESCAGFEEQVLKLELELRANKAKQAAGLVTPLAVVEAEVTLLQQKVLLQDARLKQWIKYAQLQKAAGGAWKWIP